MGGRGGRVTLATTCRECLCRRRRGTTDSSAVKSLAGVTAWNAVTEKAGPGGSRALEGPRDRRVAPPRRSRDRWVAQPEG